MNDDLKFAFRQLLRNPGFTSVAVLTLALGIGANTAIFSIMDAVLFKMLPVKEPQELVVLTHAGGDRSGNGFSYPVFERLRDRNQSFSQLIAFSTWPELTLGIKGRDEPLPQGALLVSGNYHSALGVPPLLGRLISDDDNRVLGGHPVVVVGYGFWKHRLEADPSVVGQTISLNGTPFTVIGVTPPEFFGMRVGRTDALTIPIMMQSQIVPGAALLRDPVNWSVEVMGRLKSGFSEAQTMAALRPIFQQIELEMEGGNPSPERVKIIGNRRIELSPASKGLSELRRQFSEPLRILMFVVGLVLLIACANVANLLLSKATARRKEIAVRLALGAERMRIVRQLLTESLLLGLLGGLAGLIVARWASHLAVALIPDRSGSITLNISPDARVLAFTALASILTGILFGLFPALQASRVALSPALKDTGHAAGRDKRTLSVGNILVGGQVALSLVLLIGAGLFVRTFSNLQRLNPGFARDNVLLFSLDSRMRGLSGDQAFTLVKVLLERLGTIPGVTSVTASRDGNFGGGGRTRTDINVEGEEAQSGNDHWVYDVPASPRFFGTFGTPLLSGRDFTLQDDPGAPRVAVLSQTAARHFFGNQNPIGRRINPGSPEELTIIGVAQDAKLNDLREENPRVMYRSFLQSGAPRRMTFALRTGVAPLSLLPSVRHAVESVDRDLPLFGFTTLRATVEKAVVQERFFAVLSTLFGLLALALAAVGIYGVMSYSVGQRTREIGVRMALGAGRRAVLGLVLGQGMKVVLIGLAVGTAAALALARLIASRLYGVTPSDPAAFTIVSALLGIVAAFACLLPARRASKLQPMIALRYE